MIKKIICLILGHKNISRYYHADGPKDPDTGAPLLYSTVKMPFCTRCGETLLGR